VIAEKQAQGDDRGLAGDGYAGEMLETLRRSDRDRFLCVLAAPADQRRDLTTLYSFNAEIAGIADKVSEPMLALIRLQWWRDALADIAAGRGHRHYLVQALAELVARRGLDLALLGIMLNGREGDVEASPPADLAALESYAAATAGALGEAAATICVPRAGNALRDVARAAGTAYGLVGLLRATPFLARRRVVRLPAAEMMRAQSSIDLLCDLKPDAHLPHVVETVAARADALLAAARQAPLGRADRRQGIGALLPGRLARLQLERLRRHGYDPFAPEAIAASPLDIWRLLAARWRGRI
jgi:phytoene/squalene synthetase